MTGRMTSRHRLFGSIGSPYALKMRALLRYRRIPFDWVPASLDWVPEGLPHDPVSKPAYEEIQHIRPPVVPIMWFPEDDSYRNDTTPLAYELEARRADRSVMPDDPALAFLSHLLEDMADEWGVKIAFHYRWGHETDALFKSRIVATELLGGGYSEDIQRDAGLHFARRQQSRMALVGCTPENAPLIEEVYRRLLTIMQALQAKSLFLFGSRASLADMGWYGQLESLATDPTSRAVMAEHGPATFQWLQVLEDASGVEGNWLDGAALDGHPVGDLLSLAGDVYLPFLAANAAAIDAGDTTFSYEALGHSYSQDVFKYQAKCWRIIREQYAALDEGALATVKSVLSVDPLVSK